MEQEPVVSLFTEADFESIFKTHFKGLHAYAFSFVRDWDIAEEIVQGMFVKVWEKRSVATINSSVKSYLYKAVYNDTLNYLRGKKVHLRYQTLTAYAMKNDTPDTAGKVKLSEVQQKLYESLNKLPEKCRAIFHLSRFEELKYKDIASQLGISIKTVETQMVKALKVLRNEMREYLPVIALFIVNLFKL